MPVPEIIVLGASAGGVEPLQELVRSLPADFPGSIFVVMHIPARGRTYLPDILTRAGKIPAAHAVDGESIKPGRIYIARQTIIFWSSTVTYTSTADQRSSTTGLASTSFFGPLLRFTRAVLSVSCSAGNWMTEPRVSGKFSGGEALLLYNTLKKRRFLLCH